MRQELIDYANHVKELFPSLKDKETISVRGVEVPLEVVFNWKTITVEELLAYKNAEVISVMIRNWRGKSGGVNEFIKEGGGELYMKPDKDDYQDGCIYKLSVADREAFFLKVINQTIEPGAEELSVEERKKIGLTEEGRKVYILGVPSIEFKGEQVPAGKYYVKKHSQELIPSRLMVALNSGLLEKAGDDAFVYNGNRIEFEECFIPFTTIRDAIGWTWQMNPGEYNPTIET